MDAQETENELTTLLEFIRSERGFDFGGYKRPSLERRIGKRMQDVGIGSYGVYRDYLEHHDDEFVALFNTILINVTAFFRDELAWDYLRNEVVPQIVENQGDGEPIRVWSTGCASGEEAYSLAIVLAEALGEEAFRLRVKIYATDVDDDALTTGRHAAYPLKTLEPVPEPLREKYFERVNTTYLFRSDLRRSVIFGRHDLIQDPPISKIDLLVSRNTLMYFDTETQRRILASFHFALRHDGFLFLGKSEMLASRSSLFVPVDLKRRVFAKAPTPTPAVAPRPRETIEDELARMSVDIARQAGFEAAPLALLVIGRDGRLLLANVMARSLFDLAGKDLGRPLQDLQVSYRPVELRSRIDQAYADRHTVTLRDVEWQTGKEVRFFDVHVTPLISGTGDMVGSGITFTDVTRYQRLQQALVESKREVETAYEELQSTVEELETTNEELQSTNEELETTNEELQSTNEELETMNEELQSTNEELSTINDELHQRTDELNELDAFHDAVLSSIRAAVVVVDAELHVTAWNSGARELWGLTADEVDGKHFLNLDIGMSVEQLASPLRRVLAGDDVDHVELDAVNRRGRAVRCRVHFSPLYASETPRGVIMIMEAREAPTA
ncbi:MAG TPA: CheR family methyltransferase [Gaiellaceae bacterium]